MRKYRLGICSTSHLCRCLTGTLLLAAMATVVACGGNGNGTVTVTDNGGGGGTGNFAITPSDALLNVGQSTNYAVIPTDVSSRQGEVAVVVSGWSVLDPAIATVVGAGASAAVTGVADGQTTLTAVTDQGTLQATVRVGAESVPQETLEELASFLTQAAADGTLTNAPSELPVALGASQTLLADLDAAFGAPQRLAAFALNPAVFDRNPVTITPADLFLGQDATASRVATNDGRMDAQIRDFISNLGFAGFDELRFVTAWQRAEFHEEGEQADGIHPNRGVPAVTFTPGVIGIGWYNGSVVCFGGSDSHTIFKRETAEAIRSGKLIKDNHVTEQGSTVLHELSHVYLNQTARGSLDLEPLVGQLEGVLRGSADLALTTKFGTPDPTALERFFKHYSELLLQPKGYELLNAFGLRKEPAALNLTAPQEVNVNQTFTVSLALSGQNVRPNENVLVQASGAVVGSGRSIVRTGSGGLATLTLKAGTAEGVIVIQAQFLGDSRTVEVAVVDPNHPGAYVVLDSTLTADQINLYPAGSVIFLKRVTHGHVAGPEAGCNHDHLHGPMIDIDGDGPLTDPAPNNCGYGKVYHGTIGPLPGG